MGIPAYNSFIQRNYTEILRGLRSFRQQRVRIDHLYLDSNSLIYDAAYQLLADDAPGAPDTVTDDAVIAATLRGIWTTIAAVAPETLVFITFDGVAPLAKMKHQRARRCKTHHRNHMLKPYKDAAAAAAPPARTWDTVAITPGTQFMAALTRAVHAEFGPHAAGLRADRCPVNMGTARPRIQISCADEPGEGEHKLFQFVRDHPDMHRHAHTVVYGLDADLIMLSLIHLQQCAFIHLYRETSYLFKTFRDAAHLFDPDETYLMDVRMLANTILTELDPQEISVASPTDRLLDYIFLCFLLGNDFLPQHAALSIRTNGLEVLQAEYQRFLAHFPGQTIIHTARQPGAAPRIDWLMFGEICRAIAARETELLQDQHRRRDALAKRIAPINPVDDPDGAYDQLPILRREVERFIAPFRPGWQGRYYQALFHGKRLDHAARDRIVIDYLHTLEWTLMYYTVGCPHWQWMYPHEYPPLMRDIAQVLPEADDDPRYVHRFHADLLGQDHFLTSATLDPARAAPVTPLIQLCYVLPTELRRTYLPIDVVRALHECPTVAGTCTVDDTPFLHAYCKFAWEMHPILPPIQLDRMADIVNHAVHAANTRAGRAPPGSARPTMHATAPTAHTVTATTAAIHVRG